MSVYIPRSKADGELSTLWLKIRNDAKEKFGKEFGKHESNEWVVDNISWQEVFRSSYSNVAGQQKHGLFEGLMIGNKTFKDDYDKGLRIKHKPLTKQRDDGAQGGLEPRLAA